MGTYWKISEVLIDSMIAITLKNDNDDNVFNSLNIFTILPLNT